MKESETSGEIMSWLTDMVDREELMIKLVQWIN